MIVAALYVLPARGAAPVPREVVRCGLEGLEGDYKRDGTVTLVEGHVVPDYLVHRHRRQVVVDMGWWDATTLWTEFGGHTMYVGSAVLRPLETCEPCVRLAKLTGGGKVPRELVHTGLRCRVVEPGNIAAGSQVGWTMTSYKKGDA